MSERHPQGWGEDSLSEFIDRARQNSFGTFCIEPEWYRRVSDIHDLFARASDGIRDPESTFGSMLLARARAAYLAGATLAVQTQVGEIGGPLRNCLEYGLYADFLAAHPEMIEVWLNRDDSARDLRAARRVFKPSDMVNELEQRDSELGRVARHLYDLAITTGAHPNPMAVFGNMRMDRNDEGDHIHTHVLLASDALDIRVGLKFTARCGLVTLKLFCNVLPVRFEGLGVGAEIGRLSDGL